MPLMTCPICSVGMLQVQRSGIEIDTCPKCRGIWLDRGELETLLQPVREELQHWQNMETPPPPQGSFNNSYHEPPRDPYRRHDHQYHSDHHEQGRYSNSHHHSDRDQHYRKKGPLESLMDIFD
ncbi:MAG: zf-TFIIB domain-containing protein [Magnetococcales bacterium]|nr:zf-TFIIB domain-containing protein [Magnetococcales bacterium]